MSESTDGVADQPGGYIRGGTGLPTDSRNVWRAALVAVLVALAILAFALFFEAARHNARDNRLHRDGVAVQVTVTSCLGRATGTGITVNGFTCRGSFDFHGRRYTDVISGNTRLLRNGEVIRGVTDPGSLSVLTTASTVPTRQASWHAYLVPAIPAALLLVVGGLALWSDRRNTRRPERQRQATAAR